MITVAKHEFIEGINEILDMAVENGETIEITDQGKIIAHLVPVHKPEQPGERDLKTFWTNIDQLAAKVSAYLPEKVDAVEIVREGRRELPVSEPKQPLEQSDAAAWADLKRIASELAPYWSDKNVDAAEIVRDVRHEL
ncbi:MAG: type II toxin-antitoxin system Phd/YefM family antitoxin [Ktedonobacteraceae bacterium]